MTPNEKPESDLRKAAEDSKHRVQDAIKQLEERVDALKKLKIKPNENDSRREN